MMFSNRCVEFKKSMFRIDLGQDRTGAHVADVLERICRK